MTGYNIVGRLYFDTATLLEQHPPGCVPDSLQTASASRFSSSGSHFPELHMSLIRRHLSFTDDALLPIAAPIIAQSLPWIVRNLAGRVNIKFWFTAMFQWTILFAYLNVNNRLQSRFYDDKTETIKSHSFMNHICTYSLSLVISS